MKEAYNKALQHAISEYPMLKNFLESIHFGMIDTADNNVLAFYERRNNYIIAREPTINHKSLIKTPEDLYNLFIHELSHAIQYKFYPNFAVAHGKEFKEIAHNLGLKHPTGIFVPTGHTLYRVAVPYYSKNTGKSGKNYGYVSEQYLNEHPEYRQYVIKELRE